MSFTDNWSDEEFIRQMKELIGNEGDIHVTCNHSEGEQVTETHVHAESAKVSPEGRPRRNARMPKCGKDSKY